LRKHFLVISHSNSHRERIYSDRREKQQKMFFSAKTQTDCDITLLKAYKWEKNTRLQSHADEIDEHQKKRRCILMSGALCTFLKGIIPLSTKSIPCVRYEKLIWKYPNDSLSILSLGDCDFGFRREQSGHCYSAET